MKEIKTDKGNFLFIEVPDDAKGFSFGANSTWIYYYKKNYHNSFDHRHIEVKFQTEIISTTKDILEKQAESIVDNELSIGELYYKDYDKIQKSGTYFTAKESLQSLIQANGLDINKNYLILLVQ